VTHKVPSEQRLSLVRPSNTVVINTAARRNSGVWDLRGKNIPHRIANAVLPLFPCGPRRPELLHGSSSTSSIRRGLPSWRESKPDRPTLTVRIVVRNGETWSFVFSRHTGLASARAASGLFDALYRPVDCVDARSKRKPPSAKGTGA